MLIGREEELLVLQGLLEQAPMGRSGALVFVGEAGVGKTALLEQACREADGYRLLRTTGIESEMDLPFAALYTMLRPVLHLIDEVPPAQARGLRAALALEDGERDPLAACAGTLSLLAAAAERQPVLVVADDAHWLDRASGEALAFAARRIAGESLVMLFGVRTPGGNAFPAEDLRQLHVQPLADGPALELLRTRWGEAVAPGVASRIVAATGGNPLALVEVPALLSEGERAGVEPLDEPLPVSETVARAVRRAMRSLPDDTREALLVAAASDEPEPKADAALQPAEDADLVALRDGYVAFRHPLVRAAVYRIVSPDDRRRAHLELAARAARAGEEDRSAWHLAAAAPGPDEAVAAGLEQAATRAGERGGFRAQAHALARAADLSEDDDARGRRLHAAAAAAYLAGLPELAMQLAERALPLAHDPLLRSDVLHRRAVIADWYGRWHEGVVPAEELEQAASRVAPLDPGRAAGLLGVILQRRFQALQTREALELAERRLALCEAVGGERHLRAVQDLARATGLRGDAARCAQLCDETLAMGPDGVAYATNIAEPLVWLERYDACRHLLNATVDAARREGNAVRLTFELTNLAVLELRAGRLRAARLVAAEALTLAEAAGNDYLTACNLATVARLDAIAGDREACRRGSDRARALAERLGDELIRADVAIAQAQDALVAGDAASAIGVLEPIRRLADDNEIGEPSVLPFAPDLIEALIRAGDRRRAAQELGWLEQRARPVERRWALAAVARYRGVMTPTASFAESFMEALELHEDGSPFDRARTELCYGERLRRARRRVDARTHLRAALELFDSLGARPWSERARGELEATGESIPRREPTAPDRLTPQELHIALQVAEGKSNRDVAAALFISPKTVEFHLTRIYRKLDLNSRAELIRLFASDADRERLEVAQA